MCISPFGYTSYSNAREHVIDAFNSCSKKPQKSPTAVDNKALAKKEAELEKKEKELSKKQNLDEYDAEDGFLVAEDEDDEQDGA